MNAPAEHSAFSPYPSLPPPAKVSLTQLPDQPCPYLPSRVSTTRALYAEQMPPSLYHRFMDAGFRRSGKLIYQPVCRGCRACQPIRVPVSRFEPSKSQRRCRRRNADLLITAARPAASQEKFELYRRYLEQWHGRAGEGSYDAFASFLCESPVDTLEFSYRDPVGKLLAVGVCDVAPQSLSSVYLYHDRDASRRGLGTFGALHEIDVAARLNIPHYYLGYWIDGCSTMHYKSSYRPCEILHSDGVWRPVGPPSSPGLDP